MRLEYVGTYAVMSASTEEVEQLLNEACLDDITMSIDDQVMELNVIGLTVQTHDLRDYDIYPVERFHQVVQALSKDALGVDSVEKQGWLISTIDIDEWNTIVLNTEI